MSVSAVRNVEGLAEAEQPLTYRERLFVSGYFLNGCNASETLRRLGFGGKNPDSVSARYMARPRVQKAIQAKLSEAEKGREVSVERIKARYAEFAFAKHDGPILAGHVLQALDKLGNHLGMFKPDMAVSVPVQFNFIGGPELQVDSTPPPGMQIMVEKPEPR